jgi:exopolysaccharide biosynthesis polyprenyl glycosylphosphotransferase
VSQHVLDRDAESGINRTSSHKGSVTVSNFPHAADATFKTASMRRGYQSRLDRPATTAIPAALAALAALVVTSQSAELALLLIASGLALLGFGLMRPAQSQAADTIVLIGRGPMAAVIASTIEARATRNRSMAILRAVSPVEATMLVRSSRCDEVIIAGPSKPIQADLVDARGVRPAMMSGAEKLELLLGRIPLEFAGQDKWFGRLGKIRALDPTYAHAKRALDLVFSLTLGLIILPLIPLIAIAIKLGSKGPVFYSQRRIGLGGKPFEIYKFRTMRMDAEANGAVWAQAADPRVTRAGRFMRLTRIDELPQLWNVLRGEMAVVGPRPERPEFTEVLEREIPGYELRHTVKPGLTGWAQVCYRYTSSIRDTRAKVEYDLFYVKHLSLRFDLTILARTVKVVLGRQGQ